MLRRNKAWFWLTAALLVFQAAVPGVNGNGNGSYIAHAAQEASSIPLKPITKFSVDKARYNPGEKVTFTLHFDQSKDWSDTLNLQIYQLDTLVAEGSKEVAVQKTGSGDLEVQWSPPSTDYRGYMAKAWFESAPDEAMTAAVDVSSDWTHFPRYGYVSEFPKETPEQSDAKLKQLSQDYYLNGYQFYDWMWRHDVSVYSKTDANGSPLRDASGDFITAPIDENTGYADLLGRMLYPLTIKQEVAAAQKYGSAAMAYEMNYAAREHYEKFGVKPEWGLYNKNAVPPLDPQKDQVGFFFDGVKPNPTALYLQDPGNPEWRAYITKEFRRAVNEFGFDGIHLDQWGAADNDFLLGYAGNKRYYSLDFDKIINDTKDALTDNNSKKNNVTFNMVGGNAGYSAVPDPNTKTDFDYSEIWQDKDRYKDLKEVVNDTRAKNGGKAMVIAGYMNYKQATGVSVDAASALDVPHTVAFQSRIGKAAGWVGDFGKQDEDQIEFTVTAPEAGNYNLKLYYGQGNDSGAPEGYLSVNGQLQADHILFDQNTGWGNPVAFKELESVPLNAGENKIKLQLHTSGLWLNIARLEVAGHGLDKAYQAVFADLTSCKVDQYGNVYYFETDGDYVTFHVNVPSEGDYPLAVSYSVAKDTVKRSLYVNGDTASKQEVAFPSTGTWDDFRETAPITVHLKAGDNTVTLKDEGSNDTGVKLQYLGLNGDRYMAEFADIGWAPTQPALITKVPAGAESAGYIDSFKQQGDFVQLQLPKADTSGSYPITVTYKNSEDPVERVIYINGRKAGTIALPSTGASWGTASLNVYLKSSDTTNEVVVKKEDGTAETGIQIDKLAALGVTLEAEDGVIGWKPVVPGTVSISPVIGQTDDFGKAGQSVTFTVDTMEDVQHLEVLYRTDNNPVLSVAVDGKTAAASVPFSKTSGGWDGAFTAKTLKVPIEAGKHTVTLSMVSDGQYINVSSIVVGGDEYSVANAEITAGGGTEVKTKAGYADDFKDDGDFITFNVNVPAAGSYDLVWRYTNESREVSRSVVVNDGAPQAIAFPVSGSWSDVTLSGVKLNAGLNQVTISVAGADDDGIRLDALKVKQSDLTFLKVYEAEKADFLPPMTLYKDTILHFGHIGDSVSFDIEVPQDGEASLIYTYSNPGSTTSRAVFIDGVRQTDLNGEPGRIYFDGTGSSEKYSEDGYFIVPFLKKGTHRVTLKMDELSEKGSIRIRQLTLGYFNEPSLRLMDAGLAALGATHIELGTAENIAEGPNMLAHEYYPNRSKKLLDSTKEIMKEYYKFIAAYENLLFDSREDTAANLQVAKDGGILPLSQDGAKNTLWYTVRKNSDNKGFERYDAIHLINLLNNDDNWRNAAAEPQIQTNLKVTYPIGIAEKDAKKLKVYAATPDADHGMLKELNYVWEDTNLVIDLPSLQTWSMIVIDKDPQKDKVDKLFDNQGKTDGNPGNGHQEDGGVELSEGAHQSEDKHQSEGADQASIEQTSVRNEAGQQAPNDAITGKTSSPISPYRL